MSRLSGCPSQGSVMSSPRSRPLGNTERVPRGQPTKAKPPLEGLRRLIRTSSPGAERGFPVIHRSFANPGGGSTNRTSRGSRLVDSGAHSPLGSETRTSCRDPVVLVNQTPRRSRRRTRSATATTDGVGVDSLSVPLGGRS